MFNPFGSTGYNFLQPSARRKDDPGWGWWKLLGIAALATAAGVLFGLLDAGIVLVLSALALVALRVRRARAAKRRARSSHHESPIPK
ncbi:MAG TPA: hypothetical protein VH914_03760 [Acidimicrobiia bacterium]|jgi:hypothetical protein|nr:hypothetical protein [Acidimicrobiia bacterium]